MILVTGATGLIGTQLTLDLCKQGYKVRAFKRENSIIPIELSNIENLEWFNGDILDIFSIEDALQNIDIVFHCAAIVSFNSKDRKKMLQTNVEGTANLVNACLDNNIKKLIHVSSIAALGDSKNNNLISESNNFEYTRNTQAYAKSKYQSENEVWRGIAEGLNAVIVNPSVVIGKNNGNNNLIETLKKLNKFYTSGATGFVDVRDVSDCMIKLMKSDINNERFILNSENKSFKQIADYISHLTKTEPPSIKITKTHLSIIWRLSFLISKITRSSQLVTKNIALAASATSQYSNQKILKAINHEFISINNSLQQFVI